MERRGIKRVRSANFSNTERSALVDIIERNKDVVENKKTDRVTSRLKEITWHNMCEEFNSNINVKKRNVKQLKSFYDNFKRQVKKDRANDRIELFKTGGGVFARNVDEASNRLISILGDQVDPLNNAVDSDAQFQATPLECLEVLDSNPEEEIINVVPMVDSCAREDVIDCVVLPTVEPNTRDNSVGCVMAVHTVDPKAGRNEKSTPCATPSWLRRKRPSLSKETDEARANIIELSRERKLLFLEERQMLKDKEQRDRHLYEMQVEVLQIQKRAAEAKLKYYEKRLQ